MRTRSGRRSTAISLDDVRQRHLRRHLRGSVLLRRAADRRRRAARRRPGRLHTARSRNDIDMTMYRMQQRELVLGAASTASLRAAARSCSISPDAHRETVFAAHTHTQPAQPSHHRALPARRRSSSSSATRCASRRRTRARTATRSAPARSPARDFRSIARARRELLGFDAANGEHLRQHRDRGLSAREHRRRPRCCWPGSDACVQDLLLWCTTEFGYLRLSDGFVQCSSIMPQKRNPVALEHARAIASKALGQAMAILLARPQHAVRRHRRYRRRSAAAGDVDVQGREPGRAPGGGGDGDSAVRSRAAGGAGGAGLDHRDRAGGYARAGSWRPVQDEPFDCREVRGCVRAASIGPAFRGVARRVRCGARAPRRGPTSPRLLDC